MIYLKEDYKHEGNRTLDFQNRNLMLYPLSYMLLILRRLSFFNFIIFLSRDKNIIKKLILIVNFTTTPFFTKNFW